MASFVHHGPWDTNSRQCRALRFIENYTIKFDSLDLSTTPSSAYYSPLAIFHDNRGDAHLGGSAIWSVLQRLFSPFSKIFHEVVEVRVVSNTENRDVVYGEFLTHFWLKGDNEEIVAPRFFVWTLGEAAEGEGTDGLQFVEVRLFWDTGVLGRYITEKNKKERERERASESLGKPLFAMQ